MLCYLDDLLTFSQDKDPHEKHLRIDLHCVREAGLAVNPKKSKFFQSSVEYLGHVILENGISPMPHHTTAVDDFPVPEDVSQLQRFVGMDKMTEISKPLWDLFKKDLLFEWGPWQQAAFDAINAAVVGVASLAY